MEKRKIVTSDGTPLEIRLLPSGDLLRANVFDGDKPLAKNDYTASADFLSKHSIEEFFDVIEDDWT